MYGVFAKGPAGRILAGGVAAGAYPAASVVNIPWWLVSVASAVTIIGVTVGALMRRRHSRSF